MATPPTAPVIRNAPKASPNTLEYFWYPPQSQGSAALTGYRLALQPGNLVYTTGVTNYTMVTGLTNGTTYQTTIEATNDSGATYGPPASFREFQPGSPPQVRPSSVVATAIQPNAATVSWTAPQTLPNATIFWYVVTGISSNAADPIISTNGYALSQSNVFITGLNSNSSYYFNVRAVNCPGYSPPLATNTIVWVTAPTAFSPTQLGGLNLWLDASQLTGLTNGQALTTWVDKSANAYTGTAVAGPTYQTNVLNSKPIVRFNGTSQYVDFGNVVNIGTNSGLTIFSIIKFNTATNAGIVNKTLFGPGTGRWAQWRDSGNIGTFVALDNLAPPEAKYLDSSTTPMLLETAWDRQTISIFKNATQQGASVASVSAANLTNTYKLLVAAYNDGTGLAPQAGYYYNGDVAEVLVYLVPLTPFDRQKVEGYLAWKWGLQTSLPTTHPFYISSPLSNTVFAPTSFSGLRLWIDAQDATTVTTTGVSIITQLRDKSSNAFIFSSVSGYGYTPSSFNTSYPSFTGLGTSGNSLGFNASFTLTNPNTIFFVGKNDKTAGNYGFVYCNPGNTNALFYNNSDRYSMYAGTQVDNLNTAGTSQSNILISAVYNGASSAFIQNGSIITSGFNPGTNSITGGLLLGQWYSANNFAWGGKYCELLMFSGTLATQDRQTVEGYLAWKWGLQGGLPLTHPYKFINPAVIYTTSMIVPQGLLVNFTATSYSGSGTWTNVGALGTNANATIESGTPSKNAAGNGVVLNGSTGFTFPDISLGNAWSVSIWVKHTSLPFSSAASWVTQIGVGGVINVMIYGNFSVVGGNAGPSQISGGFYNGTTLTNPTALTITPNIWYHLTWTWNGSSLTFYISGVLSSAITSANVASSSGFNYRIGRSYDGSSYMTGEVGQALIYNRALTAAEVLQNYNATASTYTV